MDCYFCCCCCYWPPIREVCPNYELVEFQPRTFTTPYLGSVAYCYVAYLLYPPYPLLPPSHVPPPPPFYFDASTIGSSTHLGVPRLCPRIHKKPSPPLLSPSLLETDSPSPPSPPPFLSDSCRCRSLTAAKIFFNVAPSCCSVSSCRHHGSRNFPPPAYPVSFAHTSNIGQRVAHSATFACLRYMDRISFCHNQNC